MIENLYLFLLYSYFLYSLDVNNQEKDNNQVRLLLGKINNIFFRYNLLVIIIIIDYFDIAIEETFELKRGWALKSNQKYGTRGAGKRMTKTVKAYLESYF